MLPSHHASHAFPRVFVGGKWLRVEEAKWLMRGVCYGPFKPNSEGAPFPEDEALRRDFAHIQRLGFNTVRLYELPTTQVLHAAEAHELRLLCGIPWTDHVDFLRDKETQKQILAQILSAVESFKAEPCVLGFLIGNEIEKTLVRWMGPPEVREFLDELIEKARAVAPEKLFSYATYPSTEYLIPHQVDFLAVNLYLEQPEALKSYLQRLQNLAGNKPLLITEFGLDVTSHDESDQAETCRWFHEACQDAAVAGTVWFSYTDEWFRGGEEVTGWRFGLVDVMRREREVCAILPQTLKGRSILDSKVVSRISVIVCTYNGLATLAACLESLSKVRYPDFEVLLIDDGSTVDIASVAQAYPSIRYVRQEHAGLSVARNLGASLASGEILAYTDDDCIADEDWLSYLMLGFQEEEWSAVGGPNIPPQPRNRVEAVVAAAPGAPAHVLLTDTEAEHLPGCNLAIRKSAFDAIGGFRAQYVAAGDDVDVCWRLREAGGKLRFIPGAMVWHHRRYTVGAYLRQQRGYGTAEALLMKDHPERFGVLGGARWSGGIYGDRAASLHLKEGNIYHGPMGDGLFQGIYSQGPHCWLDWMSGVIWILLLILSLLLNMPWLAAGILVLSFGLAVCRLRSQTHPPFTLNFRETFLLLGLCWVQPVLREWARLKGMIAKRATPGWQRFWVSGSSFRRPRKLSLPVGELAFWSESGQDRKQWLDQLRLLMQKQQLTVREDDGWRLFDLETEPHHAVSRAYLTVTEYHGQQRCLTRVRMLWRVRLSTLLTLNTLLLVAGWLCYETNLGPSLEGLFLVFLFGFAAYLWLNGHRFRNEAMQAAESAGLSHVPKEPVGTPS